MSVSAVLAFGKMFGVDFLHCCEIFIDCQALFEVGGHLVAFGDLEGSL